MSKKICKMDLSLEDFLCKVCFTFGCVLVYDCIESKWIFLLTETEVL